MCQLSAYSLNCILKISASSDSLGSRVEDSNPYRGQKSDPLKYIDSRVKPDIRHFYIRCPVICITVIAREVGLTYLCGRLSGRYSASAQIFSRYTPGYSTRNPVSGRIFKEVAGIVVPSWVLNVNFFIHTFIFM